MGLCGALARQKNETEEMAAVDKPTCGGRTAGEGGSTDIQINDYRQRLGEDGNALGIDGKTYRFDEPHTVLIARDGKATSERAP
jgi:hypothetical protein